jgi:hypothetical protein
MDFMLTIIQCRGCRRCSLLLWPVPDRGSRRCSTSCEPLCIQDASTIAVTDHSFKDSPWYLWHPRIKSYQKPSCKNKKQWGWRKLMCNLGRIKCMSINGIVPIKSYNDLCTIRAERCLKTSHRGNKQMGWEQEIRETWRPQPTWSKTKK